MRCQHFGCDAERDWAKRSKSKLNWFAIINKSKHFEQVLAGYGRITGLNFAITKILIGPSLSIFWVVKYSMRYCFVYIILEAQNHRKTHFHHKHCSVMNCLHCSCVYLWLLQWEKTRTWLSETHIQHLSYDDCRFYSAIGKMRKVKCVLETVER